MKQQVKGGGTEGGRRILLFGDVPPEVQRSLVRWGFHPCAVTLLDFPQKSGAFERGIKGVVVNGLAPGAGEALRACRNVELPVVLYNNAEYISGEGYAGATYRIYPGPEELRRAISRLAACPLPRSHLPVPLEPFLDFLRERYGVVFPSRRSGEIKKAVRDRMAALRLPTVDSYLELLERSTSRDREPDHLMGALTVGETFLYRTPAHYEELRNQLLGKLLASRPGRTLRALSAGCSTGEEAYCLGALLLERLSPSRVEVLGADVNRQALETGRRGHYAENSLRGALPTWLSRHLSREGDRAVVQPPLQEVVSFQYTNLAAWVDGRAPGPSGSFDIIFCRNVLLYFDNEHSTRILRTLGERLTPGGFLFLGPSETVLSSDIDLQVRTGPDCFYLERPDPSGGIPPPPLPGRDRSVSGPLRVPETLDTRQPATHGGRARAGSSEGSPLFEGRPLGLGGRAGSAGGSLGPDGPGIGEASRSGVGRPGANLLSSRDEPSGADLLSSRDEPSGADLLSSRDEPSGADSPPRSADLEAAEELVQRGFVLLDQEDFHAAATQFRRARRLVPTGVGPRLGELYLAANSGEYQQARIGCERLVSEGATRPELYYLLGLLEDLDGDLSSARREFERALYLDPDCLMARFRLAEILNREGRRCDSSREARNMLEQLRRIGPGEIVPLSGGMAREAMETLCLGLIRSEGSHGA